jgi:superfamily II DNA helicase RecQ
MQALGVLSFRGKQEEAIESLLSGGDVLYVLTTELGSRWCIRMPHCAAKGSR